MTRLWWVSLATEMRQTTGVRWAAWLGGAGSTISLWMWRRQRRLLLISGKCTLSMLLWPSTVRLWIQRAAPSFWVCTSQRTSPGLTTLQHWPRKHSNVSTSSANSEEPEPRPPSCAVSTEAPESILTSCITVWYGACNASCRKSLQRIVRAAEKIVGVSLPSLQDIYSTRLTRKALSIAGDPTHPTHSFFSLLPSGRRLRSLQARTSRLKDSFIHPHQSLCAALEWSLPHPALSVIYLFWQSDKRLFFFLHYSHLHSFVLFNWFALYLPCALCHFISFLFFYCSTMSSFVYLYSLYVHMVKLYLSVFECLLSVFNVNCMHQGSESNAISILCMYVLYMWKNWQ